MQSFDEVLFTMMSFSAKKSEKTTLLGEEINLETLPKSIINTKLTYLFEFSYSNELYYLVEGRNVHICFEESVTLF